PGQTLVSQRIYAALPDLVDAKEVGPLQLKGFHRPIVACEVVHLKHVSACRANPRPGDSRTGCERWVATIFRHASRFPAEPSTAWRRRSTIFGRPPASTRTTPAAEPSSRSTGPRASPARRFAGWGAGSADGRSPSTSTSRI